MKKTWEITKGIAKFTAPYIASSAVGAALPHLMPVTLVTNNAFFSALGMAATRLGAGKVGAAFIPTGWFSSQVVPMVTIEATKAGSIFGAAVATTATASIVGTAKTAANTAKWLYNMTPSFRASAAIEQKPDVIAYNLGNDHEIKAVENKSKPEGIADNWVKVSKPVTYSKSTEITDGWVDMALASSMQNAENIEIPRNINRI